MKAVTSIDVKYKHVEGWHVFTSEDFPGLYVASTDAERAYNDVALSVQKLLELEFGVTCEVAAELPFREFLRSEDKSAAAKSPRRNSPAVLMNQRYAIHCAA